MSVETVYGNGFNDGHRKGFADGYDKALQEMLDVIPMEYVNEQDRDDQVFKAIRAMAQDALIAKDSDYE